MKKSICIELAGCLLALSAALLVISCSQSQQGTANKNGLTVPLMELSDSVSPVNVPKPSEVSDFYDCVDSVSFICLETSQDALLGNNFQVVDRDSLIVVIDVEAESGGP